MVNGFRERAYLKGRSKMGISMVGEFISTRMEESMMASGKTTSAMDGEK